ncbi:MAG: hypothetical protein ACJAZF_003857 [Granulosicoccus sp.]
METRFDRKFVGEVAIVGHRRNPTPSIEGIHEAGWVLRSNAHRKGDTAAAVSS